MMHALHCLATLPQMQEEEGWSKVRLVLKHTLRSDKVHSVSMLISDAFLVPDVHACLPRVSLRWNREPAASLVDT